MEPAPKPPAMGTKPESGVPLERGSDRLALPPSRGDQHGTVAPPPTNSAQMLNKALPPPLGTSSYSDTRGYNPTVREPGPVEGGLSNRQLRVGLILSNARLISILDEIDPLPGGVTRRQLLVEQGAGRMDFFGFPRHASDAGFESVAIPHHLGTTGFTRLLYSDRVDRSPLSEVQRRITQQAHFDARNVGALLNARAYSGVIAQSESTVEALRTLSVYLNATNNPDRVRKLMQLHNELKGPSSALVAKGKALFECHGCTSCHSPHLGRYTSLAVVPLKHIGTDPRHALARGNTLEGEGDFIPLAVSEGKLQVPLTDQRWILEVNRVVSPRLDRDAREEILPLVVSLDPSVTSSEQVQLAVGALREAGMKVDPQAHALSLPLLRTGARVLVRGAGLSLAVGDKTVVLREFELRGVLHPDASTWGAPLQDNRSSMLTGTVERSDHAQYPMGSKVELWISGVRSDLFAGVRKPASMETVGYRVPKLVGLPFKVGFLHDGSLKTLEELMNPARVKKTFKPTGFEGSPPGYEGVPGHTFTLLESAEEREALLAFLKSL